MNKGEKAKQDLLLSLEYQRGQVNGITVGLASVAWILRERYGWKGAIRDIIADTYVFMDTWLGDVNGEVKVKDLLEALRDEIDLDLGVYHTRRAKL